jgi:hypothetical protein
VCKKIDARKPGLYLVRDRTGKITPCPTAWVMPNTTGAIPNHLVLGNSTGNA